MAQERKDLLNAIGFQWRIKPKTVPWKEHYQKLVDFQQRFGHCNVSKSTKKGHSKPLADWVVRQRKNYWVGKLTKTQIEKLESIGFIWNIKDYVWMQHYKKLSDFYELHGHCRVSPVEKATRSLGLWVSHQRDYRDTMKPERLALLNKLNFEWEVHRGLSPTKEAKVNQRVEAIWMTKLTQLKEFKASNGHCNVPRKAPYESLSNWVNQQRVKFKKGQLLQKRVDHLNSIGFEWSRLGKR